MFSSVEEHPRKCFVVSSVVNRGDSAELANGTHSKARDLAVVAGMPFGLSITKSFEVNSTAKQLGAQDSSRSPDCRESFPNLRQKTKASNT